MEKLVEDSGKGKELRRSIYAIVIAIMGMAVVVLTLLRLFEVWVDSDFLYKPLMVGVLIIQGCFQWREKRSLAIFSLCAAGIVALLFGVELLI